MNKQIIIKKLEDLEDLKKRIDELANHLSDIFNTIDSPIFNLMDELFDKLQKEISERFEIHPESLDWFVHECKFGKHPLECEFEGKNIVVNSIETFLETL